MPVKRNLAHGRLDEIGSAHNMIHALKMVINDHRQIVGKQPVAAADNKIFFGQLAFGL